MGKTNVENLAHMFPSEGNFYAASSRGRYGNAFSVTGVLKHEYKHTMHLTLAGGRLWRKLMSICEHKRAPVEHIILFFLFRGLCFWSVSIMKRFRRCADPCQRFWHQMTHTTYALGGEHTRSVLEGMKCVHCESFLWEKLRSCSSLFLRELGRSSAPCGSGPAAAEAVKRLSSRRSQMELA